MPLNAVMKAWKTMLSKPKVFVPALVFAAINFAVLLFALDPVFELYSEILFNGLPTSSLQELPFFLLQLYPVQIGLTIFWTAVLGGLQVILLFVYARYAVEQKSISSAISYGIGKWKDVLAAIAFFAIVLVLGFTGAIILSIISVFSSIVSAILFTLYGLFLLWLSIRLILFPAAMAVEDTNLENGLKKAWSVSKSFWSLVLLLLAIAVIDALIGIVSDTVLGFIAEDLTVSIVIVLFNVVAITYASLAVAYYYIEKSSIKGKK